MRKIGLSLVVFVLMLVAFAPTYAQEAEEPQVVLFTATVPSETEGSTQSEWLAAMYGDDFIVSMPEGEFKLGVALMEPDGVAVYENLDALTGDPKAEYDTEDFECDGEDEDLLCEIELEAVDEDDVFVFLMPAEGLYRIDINENPAFAGLHGNFLLPAANLPENTIALNVEPGLATDVRLLTSENWDNPTTEGVSLFDHMTCGDACILPMSEMAGALGDGNDKFIYFVVNAPEEADAEATAEATPEATAEVVTVTETTDHEGNLVVSSDGGSCNEGYRSGSALDLDFSIPAGVSVLIEGDVTYTSPLTESTEIGTYARINGPAHIVGRINEWGNVCISSVPDMRVDELNQAGVRLDFVFPTGGEG